MIRITKTLLKSIAFLLLAMSAVFILAFAWYYLEDMTFFQALRDLKYGVMWFGRKTYLILSVPLAISVTIGMQYRNSNFSMKERVYLSTLLGLIVTFRMTYMNLNRVEELFHSTQYTAMFFMTICSASFMAFGLLSALEYLLTEIRRHGANRLKWTTVCVQRWYRAFRRPLWTAVFSGLLCYMFFMTNKLINHDEIFYLFGKGEELSSGRWGLKILEALIPNYSMPWLWGIIAIVLTAVSTCLILALLEIRSQGLQCVLAAVTATFMSQTDAFLYMFMLPCYSLAFLCTILAVILIQRAEEKAAVYKIPGIVVLVFALSIYQAFISVCAGLLLLLLIQRIVTNSPQKAQLLRSAIYYILIMGISLLAYYGITLLIMKAVGIEFNSYADTAIHSDLNLFRRIDEAYAEFWNMLFSGRYGIVRGTLSQVLHTLLLTGAFLIGFYKTERRNKASDMVWYLILSMLLPPCINALNLLLGSESTHSLTAYGFISVYLFAAIVLESKPDNSEMKKLAFALAVSSMALICWGNVLSANQIALEEYLDYQNTYSLFQTISTRIEATEGFTQNSKIAIIGYAEMPEYRKNFPHNDILGVGAIRNAYSRDDFIQYYLGNTWVFASPQEKALLKQDERFMKMEAYPANECIQWIDDYLVVKLGN